jgi:hypothetical protein
LTQNPTDPLGPSGRLLTIRLEGTVSWGPGVGEAVYGWIHPERVFVLMDPYDFGSAILERPVPDTTLLIEGAGDMAYTFTGLTGTFEGGWLWSPAQGRPASERSCSGANHTFELSR